MATIRATCGECGDVEMTSRDVWVRVCDDDQSATYAFRCPSCRLVVVKPAEPKVVDLLVASGVPCATWRMPAELHEAHSGDPINHDDLLEFHQAMQADDWLERLIQAPPSRERQVVGSVPG